MQEKSDVSQGFGKTRTFGKQWASDVLIETIVYFNKYKLYQTAKKYFQYIGTTL